MANKERNTGNIDKIDYNHENLKNYFLKMSIKNVDVEPYVQILAVVVREWVFDILPRIEITILDNGRFTDQYPLEDLDEIDIELNNMKDKDAVVKGVFQLQDHTIKNAGLGDLSKSIITLTGFLKNTNIFFPIQNRSFAGKSSSEVFQVLAGENKDITFESRIDSQDSMNWLQINQNNMMFIKDVLDRSYTRANDVNFLYTQRDGKMVYTSLQTEITDNAESKNLIYKAGASQLNSANWNAGSLKNRLDTEKEQDPKSEFFYSWEYKNIAGTVNKETSYGMSYNYYDVKLKSSVIDKEMVYDKAELGAKNTLKNKKNVGKITKHENFGYIDFSNFHQHYIDAQVQNEFIKNNFFSSYLILYCRPSNNFKLFDVVNVHLPSNYRAESSLDATHSGKWIIGGITHSAQSISLFDDVLILFRNSTNIEGYIKQGESNNS